MRWQAFFFRVDSGPGLKAFQHFLDLAMCRMLLRHARRRKRGGRSGHELGCRSGGGAGGRGLIGEGWRNLRRWRFRPPASFEEPSVDSGAVSGVLRGASVVLRRFEMRRKGDDGECRGCGPRCGARRRSRRSEMIVGPVWEKFGVGGKQRERKL